MMPPPGSVEVAFDPHVGNAIEALALALVVLVFLWLLSAAHGGSNRRRR